MSPLTRLLGLAGLCLAAQPAASETLSDCFAISDAQKRLACYDQLARPTSAPQTAVTPAAQSAAATEPVGTEPAHVNSRSYLTRVWNLDGSSGKDDETRIGRLRPFKESYVLIRETNNTNMQPTSPAPGHTQNQASPTDHAEIKFQLSFKSEIASAYNLDTLGIKDIRVWGAYTQQSNWQAFNSINSSAFRETNYEPEVIVSFIPQDQKGHLKLINLGFNHQSNGQALPLSRSWNRVYLQGGWEWDNDISLLARGWYRIPENPAQDDNPNIQDYMGYGDLVLHWQPDQSQSLNLLLRDNLRSTQNRGMIQLDWATPIKLGNLAKLHLQASHGYGESLIDYNHHQTTLGIGFSFRDW